MFLAPELLGNRLRHRSLLRTMGQFAALRHPAAGLEQLTNPFEPIAESTRLVPKTDHARKGIPAMHLSDARA
jgi:hypothetical protein